MNGVELRRMIAAVRFFRRKRRHQSGTFICARHSFRFIEAILRHRFPSFSEIVPFGGSRYALVQLQRFIARALIALAHEFRHIPGARLRIGI